jgi:hypothetical protein
MVLFAQLLETVHSRDHTSSEAIGTRSNWPRGSKGLNFGHVGLTIASV